MTGERDQAPAELRALKAGQEAFGDDWRPSVRAVAPGRIELLGNHLDYNGGPVLAAAIDRFVVVLADEPPGVEGAIEIVVADVEDGRRDRLSVDDLGDWRNAAPPPQSLDYARGAVAALRRGAANLRTPCRQAFAGDVPIGFGVSSSAALCVALTLGLARSRPEAKETVLLAQEAEHRAGTPCGTMDQSASVFGGVIRLDPTTLDVERLSPDLGDLVFAVVDSGVERSLGASSYPVRVEESKRALEIVRSVLKSEIPNLPAIDDDQWRELERRGAEALPQPFFNRVRHVVSETKRVAEGVSALQARDWAAFGRLMTASGRSSATDYEISHPRVEELVSEVLSVDGVLGARMMGGGEGGTALTLLSRTSVPALESTLRAGYYVRYGMAGHPHPIHVCAFADGARVEAV